MKKYLALIIAFSFIGCGTMKTNSEKNKSTKETNLSEKSKDSSHITEKNKAINDKSVIPVQKSDTGNRDFDAEVNRAVDRILASLNHQKSSGDNGYELYYDLIKRELQFRATIGETSNTKEKVKEKEKTEKSFEQKTDEYLSKKISQIPWWLYLIAIIYFAPKLIEGITAFTNPVLGILSRIKKA
jgi:signal recognition particle GTPase